MRTKVVHSQSKNRWKVVGKNLGGLYNYAQVEYIVDEDKNAVDGTLEGLSAINKADAYKRAVQISNMFNMEKR